MHRPPPQRRKFRRTERAAGDARIGRRPATGASGRTAKLSRRPPLSSSPTDQATLRPRPRPQPLAERLRPKAVTSQRTAASRIDAGEDQVRPTIPARCRPPWRRVPRQRRPGRRPRSREQCPAHSPGSRPFRPRRHGRPRPARRRCRLRASPGRHARDPVTRRRSMLPTPDHRGRPVTARLVMVDGIDGSRVRIDLEPADLGRVEVALRLDDSGTAAASFTSTAPRPCSCCSATRARSTTC